MMLDRFYPIVDSTAWCRRLVPLGISLIQLRMKNLPEKTIRQEIRDAKALCDEHRCQLVVNDYWQMAIEEQCDFVHLGQEDLDTADIPMIRHNGIRIGISTHDDDELESALRHQPDYVALGPVYPTILKKMKWTEQGLPRVSEWKRRIGDRPLVAIGGMRVDRAGSVFEAGADIISVVTDITLNSDPERRTQEWIAACRSQSLPIDLADKEEASS